jgi:hypothetical protein
MKCGRFFCRGLESGGALRLPPQSKTLARNSGALKDGIMQLTEVCGRSGDGSGTSLSPVRWHILA